MTGVFETKFLRNFPTEPIICVKEFAKYSFCSPKFLSGTSLNSNIQSRKNKFKKMLQSDLK